MKVWILILLFYAINFEVFAYTGKAVIDDKDGYTNIRNGKGLGFDVIATVTEKIRFWYEKDCNSDWWEILLTDGTKGYIHKSRISPLSSKYRNHQYRIQVENVEILLEITESDFTCKGHDITQSGAMLLVDGKSARGTAYSMPLTEIESIKLTWNGAELTVSKELYDDCYNPFFRKNNVYYRLTENREKLLFFLLGSDGGGVYDVLWIFDRNNNHSRAFLGCCDCSFFNFECVNF